MKDKPPDGGCSWFCRRHPDMVGGQLELPLALSGLMKDF